MGSRWISQRAAWWNKCQVIQSKAATDIWQMLFKTKQQKPHHKVSFLNLLQGCDPMSP